MRQTIQKIKKTGFLFFPIVILLGMTNCSQFHSFSETDKAKFLSENPVFRNGQGHDPLDETDGPVVCVPGYILNPEQTSCEPITCPTGQRLVGNSCEPITCFPGYRLVGNSCEPITCPTGQTHNGQRCVLITCPTGQRLVGNTCEPIICPTGQRLVGNTCEPITCPTGQRLVGNTCEPITCPEGQTLVGNTCRITTCPEGQTLVGNTCQPITTCPEGQKLVGNTCRITTCPEGQKLVGNICRPITTCPSGQRLVGNTCQPITTCPSGYRLNSAGTGCERIPPPTRPNTGDGGDGGDGGGGGDGCPLMIDSEGVEYADMNELRNSDDSYLESGELSLTAPADGVKFNLLGQQNTAQLDNGEFLHIQPEAHNFKFQISWTKSDQSRYRWLTLPDASGHVNGIDELFGDNTFGPDSESPFARDGFRALMKWDRGDAVNSDQDFSDDYIDSNDAVFSRLRLWHDLNGDGNCDTSSEISSELVTLDEMGITYIHLMANENFFETDVYGNSITYKSLVGFRASSEEATRLGTAFDIWFRYNPRELISTGYAEIRPNL